jgi:hypothetical protein
MNRHARRAAAAAEFTRDTRDQAMCPCCNVRKVVLHLMNHMNDEAVQSWSYGVEPCADDPEHLVADFGVLHLGIYKEGHQLVIHSFGERVFQMTSGGGFTIEREGPWIATLAAIQADLAHRFGPARLEHLH